MENKKKFRIKLSILILIFISVAGTSYSFIQWISYRRKISSVEYLDIALKSVEEAFQLINKTSLYRNIFIGCSILSILSLAALGVVLLLYRGKRKEEENGNKMEKN